MTSLALSATGAQNQSKTKVRNAATSSSKSAISALHDLRFGVSLIDEAHLCARHSRQIRFAKRLRDHKRSKEANINQMGSRQ
jgi:hypothetical protein